MIVFSAQLAAQDWIRHIFIFNNIAKCLFSCMIHSRCSIKRDSEARGPRWIARWNKRVSGYGISGGAHTYTRWIIKHVGTARPFFTSPFATLRTARCYRRSYITNVGCGLKFKLPSRGATIIFPRRQGHRIVHSKMQSMQFHHAARLTLRPFTTIK